MHGFASQFFAIGLAAQSARRQPKNNCVPDKTPAMRLCGRQRRSTHAL
jgi:hypothetical protein